MSGTQPAVGNVDVDLGKLFGSLLRNWLRILIFALAAAGVVYLALSFTDRWYRAETRILIEARESVFTRPNNLGTENDRPLLDEEAITSQVEVIGSADIMREVARKLDLAKHPEFGAGDQPSGLGALLVLTGLRSDPSQASVEERVLQTMRERMNIFRVDRSRVIVIRFSSRDPDLAASVPNAVADAYLAVQEEAKRLTNSDATEWLEPEIEDLRHKVREAEARVADYRAQSDLLVGQGNAVLATQQLSELSSELTRVRATRAAAEGRASSIKSALKAGSQIDAMPDVMSSPLVQRLRERQVQIEADLADLSTSLLDNHPRIRALRGQLSETGQQLRTEMQKVLSAVENETNAAREREAQLVADLNRVKAEAARAGGDEVELRALEREAAAQRALLESYLTRYREAAARADRNYLPADARIFSRASRPFESYFPKVLPSVGAAFVGSLIIAVIILLMRELFSGRAMRPAEDAYLPVEDVVMPTASRLVPESEVDQPIIASQRSAPDHFENDSDDDDFAGELSIEDAAERLVTSGASRAVFLSPEGDDAAASSVMVAREVSDAGLRVMFVDLTYLGTPSAHMLESARYPGITNLLAGDARFADVIHGDLYSDCHVIPVGTADPALAMRAVDRLPIIMTSLATAYDIVVIECGPTDAAGISRVVAEGTEVLVSVIEPEDEAVDATAADLVAAGFSNVLVVTPVGHSMPPRAPEGRFVA